MLVRLAFISLATIIGASGLFVGFTHPAHDGSLLYRIALGLSGGAAFGWGITTLHRWLFHHGQYAPSHPDGPRMATNSQGEIVMRGDWVAFKSSPLVDPDAELPPPESRQIITRFGIVVAVLASGWLDVQVLSSTAPKTDEPETWPAKLPPGSWTKCKVKIGVAKHEPGM